MRVLWVGDAVVSSGFARCSHAVCDELHDAGHEVHVLGINYWGDVHDYPYPIYTCINPLDHGQDAFGATRLPWLAARLKPDVIVLLNDPWNVPSYLDELKYHKIDTPVVAWLAVDGENVSGAELNDLHHVVVWTEFARDELTKRGYEGDTSVVPLGVDTDIFYPADKAVAKAALLPEGIPVDSFIVGVVGRNQYRKRLDLTIEYFSEWIHGGVDDAYLYLHVAPTGDSGVNIRKLCEYYDVLGRVIVGNPDIGHGETNDTLRTVYNAFDVYLTTTQGEGWGLPSLEAMACGVQCAVPDWSGLGSWVGDAAYKIPCTGRALTAPVNSRMYTVGGIADKDQTIVKLHYLYTCWADCEDITNHAGIELAKTLSWSATGQKFRRVLEYTL